MDTQEIEIVDKHHEEIYLGYEIFIEPNPDYRRGGFKWYVCKDDVELDCGMEFTTRYALNEAHKTIELFIQNCS